MAKRVLLSNASSGMAGGMGAVDAALADLATDASGNGAQFLAGDGTFKAAGLAVNAQVTPHAGGGQANATQLAAGLTPCAAPASSHDSLQLPSATAGALVILMPVTTFSGSTISVYVKNGSSDTMDGISDFVDWGSSISSSNAIPLLVFACVVAGNWLTNGSLD